MQVSIEKQSIITDYKNNREPGGEQGNVGRFGCWLSIQIGLVPPSNSMDDIDDKYIHTQVYASDEEAFNNGITECRQARPVPRVTEKLQAISESVLSTCSRGL